MLYQITIKWISGARKGIIETTQSPEKLRIGSVRSGAWGAKYKVLNNK